MKVSNFNLSIENKNLLTDVNVEFSEGKINHILGKNGVGKSIFAKSLMLDNENITVIGSYSNVPEDITFNELRKVLIKKFDMNKVDHLCSILNISNIDEKIILKKLSDGQRQKIKILVFLLFDKDIIILDEVTNALDKTTSNEIYELFNDYIKKNPKKVILNITHNLSDLNNMDGEYYLFEDYDIKKYSNRKELIDLYINGGLDMGRNIWLDGMMGLIVGDALGVPVQFMEKEEIIARKIGSVKGMESGGAYNMPAGTWSDDGSMALATLDSIENNKKIDLQDIMECFCKWELEGKYTQYGEAFDQGNTCTEAIYRYIKDKNIDTCGCKDENSNGNGSLMRILPACIFLALDKETSEEDQMELIHKVSGLTHNHLRSKMACGLYYAMVDALLHSEGESSLKNILQTGIDKGLKFYGMDKDNYYEMTHFTRLFHLDELQQTEERDMRSGGYVIETIEAAVWCLITTDSLKECLLKVVNMGHDTDTVAAVAGGLAGLYYGVDAIPKDWLDEIVQKEYIEDMCVKASSL